MRKLFRILASLVLIVVFGVGLAIYLFRPHYYQSAFDHVVYEARTTAPAVFGPVEINYDLGKILHERKLTLGAPVFIRIFKESSELEVWMKSGAEWQLAHTFEVCRWSGTLGPKMKEGDGQSPEGFYAVTQQALNPNSSYHLSFNLGFPNAYDVSLGRTGSFLMVHGSCVSIGCFAMTNGGIDVIYRILEAALEGGQASVPVHIFPFRMTDENLARHSGSSHDAFWKNLKQGWDVFERERQPPVALACSGEYRFGAGSGSNCKPIAGI